MIELKSPTEIERMRVTGDFVAEVLREVGDRAEVGVNVLDLERHARDMIRKRGAVSCYWDYAPSFGEGPFRNVICLSVNDAVLHGLPHDYVLCDGDVLTMDLAVGIDGWVGLPHRHRRHPRRGRPQDHPSHRGGPGCWHRSSAVGKPPG